MSSDEDMLDHLYKVLCDDVPSCGCGWPQEANRLVWEVLRLAPTYGAEPKRRLAALIGSEGAQQIVLAALGRAGLIDHGTVIDSLWLEARGRWVLWAVDQVGGIDVLDEKLQSAGFPHYGSECTDACWRVPEGWEPASSAPGGGVGPGGGAAPGPVVPAVPVQGAAVGDFDGIGPLLRAVMDPPAEAGPTWVLAYRTPEPVPVVDGEGRPVVDEFGEPVLRMPLLPSLTWERRPVFTGCLAFLGEEEPR